MFNVTSGTTSGVAQSTVNAILSLTQQAAAAWAPYLNFGGSSLEIEVEIVPIDGNTLAFGGTTFFTLTSGPFAGFFQASPVLELANGTDPNGAMPDITISIDLETLQAGDFHLGGPDVGGPVPGLFDLYTVLIHEIGHGLGHLGFGDDPDVQSVFDSFVTVDDGSLFFTGPETASINSGPLRLSDDSHVQFVNDLMSASIGRGQRQSISDINISVLQDIGMPILLPTNNDDVLQGFEFATLAPGVTSGDDIIDLLGGNDTYFGLSGNDVVSGGAGDDTVFGGLGADDIRGDADEDFLFGGSGDDVLTGGAGSDTFVFLADEDHDIITDFSGGSSGDIIEIRQISGIQEFLDVLNISTEVGNNLVITLSSIQSITLLNASISDLSDENFFFQSGSLPNDGSIEYKLGENVNSSKELLNVFSIFGLSNRPSGPYSIELSGADADLFRVDSVGGGIFILGVLDHENPTDLDSNNLYDFNLSLNRDSQTETVSIQLRIGDINENMGQPGNSSLNIMEEILESLQRESLNREMFRFPSFIEDSFEGYWQSKNEIGTVEKLDPIQEVSYTDTAVLENIDIADSGNIIDSNIHNDDMDLLIDFDANSAVWRSCSCPSCHSFARGPDNQASKHQHFLDADRMNEPDYFNHDDLFFFQDPV